jgi:hypothetical protein|tara:strand:+ start:16 stop:393 length:378 start_codon:yes stop_codon:yes gene_type:complete
MEKLKMDKRQLDLIKRLDEEILALEGTAEVQKYLEQKRVRDQMRRLFKNWIIDNLILKPSSFGMRKTWKEFSTTDMHSTMITKDKKNIQGIIKGNKTEAFIKLSHRAPYEVKPSAVISFKQWRNS